jgi:hypothetical protein
VNWGTADAKVALWGWTGRWVMKVDGLCLDLSMYFKGGKEREGRGGWRCGFKTHLQYVIIAPGSERLGGGGGGGHGRVTRA